MTEELGIVLGTVNTVIYKPGNGIVLCEPSAVAYLGNPKAGKVRAVGEAAAAMLGKAPENTTVCLPMKDGVIAEPSACRDMLTAFFAKLMKPRLFAPKIRAIVAVPMGLTLEERRIYEDTFTGAGVHEVVMVEKIMLAAVGIDLPVHGPKVSLIANLGGGLTEIAAISSAGIVKGCGINIGGRMMDRAFKDYVLGKYRFKIGMSEAAAVKRSIGSLYANDCSSTEVSGTDIAEQIPASFMLKSSDVLDSVMPYYLRIADAIENIVKVLPPETSEDISTDGLFLTGGASKILGLERMVSERLRLPVTVHREAEYAAAMGAGKLLSNSVLLREILAQN